jgi:hypothetical protein
MTKAEAIAAATKTINETEADLETSEGLGQLASELQEAFDSEAEAIDPENEEAEEEAEE